MSNRTVSPIPYPWLTSFDRHATRRNGRLIREDLRGGPFTFVCDTARPLAGDRAPPWPWSSVCQTNSPRSDRSVKHKASPSRDASLPKIVLLLHSTGQHYIPEDRSCISCGLMSTHGRQNVHRNRPPGGGLAVCICGHRSAGNSSRFHRFDPTVRLAGEDSGCLPSQARPG